ncbi:MAG: sulfate adenylyltransferase subunit CysN [Hyphomonadaceae bacterium]
MAQTAIAANFDAYLDQQENKTLLRFITCGSVDDGKSTLIGRLLYDSKMIFEDQLAALERDSKKVGTQGGDLDFALLVDGLAAEREQGITIDVAYRFFATDKRKFIVADTPGHEQYTRNMVTGASTADLAVVLIDARKGVLTQTRRHAFLVSLVGIKRVVLAVNKMDLVDWSRETFDDIEAEFRAFARKIGLDDITAIPLSGLKGDNVKERGDNASWYKGPTLLEVLETAPLSDEGLGSGPFRMPVQWVSRPDQHFRGYAGLIASGIVAPGDRVRILPSGRTSRVARVVTRDGDLARAGAGRSVTVTLEDEIDISRGDVIATADDPPAVADQFETMLVWMADASLLLGRSYWLKIGANLISAHVSEIDHKVDVNTLERLPADFVGLNEIAACTIKADRPIPFDPYDANHDMGGFILIDRGTNATVAAGMIRAAARRPYNAEVTREVIQAYQAGEPVNVIAARTRLSPNLIRLWVQKYETGDQEDDIHAAALIEEYEARIAELERQNARLRAQIKALGQAEEEP